MPARRRLIAGLAGLLVAAVAIVAAVVLLSGSSSPETAADVVPNLIANPSFEDGVDGWTSCGGRVRLVTDGDAPSGEHVAEVRRAGPSCDGLTLNQASPALNGSTIQGQTVIASALVRGIVAAPHATVSLVVRERDAAGDVVGQVESTPLRLGPDYQRLQRSFTSVDSGDDLEIYLAAHGGASAFRADELSLSVLDDTVACPHDVANFGVDAWPPACWRPYSQASAFNTPLSGSDQVSRASLRVVDQLVRGSDAGSPDPLAVGDPSSGSNIPIYYAEDSDPLFTLDCLGQDRAGVSAPCNGGIDGARIRVPAQATPAGGLPGDGGGTSSADRHMTVIEPDGTEYDLYNVTGKDLDAGTLTFAGGGVGPITGDGTGFGAIASHTGAVGGLIRGQELAAGVINHALQMYVPCVSGDPVAPAEGDGLQCARALRAPNRHPDLAGIDACAAPAMGSRFRLAISDQEISRLAIPEYERAIVRALAHYGAYVVDTSGHRDSWGFRVEGAGTYEDFGRPDPAAELAAKTPQAHPIAGQGAGRAFTLPVDSGIDWTRLRLLDGDTGKASPKC